MTSTRDAAFTYAELGWPVFPLAPRSKIPHAGTNGVHDATCNPARLAVMFPPGTRNNIGLATGHRFDVLDAETSAALHTVDTFGDSVCGGPMATTGKPEGRHVYFRATGDGNRTRIRGLELDWRGRGGYVVAPGSIHPNGSRYEWMPGYGPDTPLEDPPAAVVALLAPEPRPPFTPIGSRGPIGAHRWTVPGLLADVAHAIEGTRNVRLYSAARRINDVVTDGSMTERDARHILEQLHTAAMSAGLGETEADLSIRSACPWLGGR